MTRNAIPRILIAAGGTGGHVFPGVALAEAFRKRWPTARIVFAGTERGLESRIVPSLGFELVTISSRSLKDRGPLGRMLAMMRIPFSIACGLRIIRRERPDILISVGGYAAGPLALAAWILRVPVVVIEPNAIAGFTNRILGRIARCVFAQFDETTRFFGKNKVRMTGNPVRSDILSVQPRPIINGPLTVFVFGGSQGARRLNEAMVAAVPALQKRGIVKRVIHQVGDHADAEAIRTAYTRSGVDADVRTFIDDMAVCYERSDLLVARAGATSIAELKAVGVPAVLVPYPYAADDHQRANAGAIADMGGGRMVLDAECTPERMVSEITAMADPAVRSRMRERLLSTGHRDAAHTITMVCETWI